MLEIFLPLKNLRLVGKQSLDVIRENLSFMFNIKQCWRAVDSVVYLAPQYHVNSISAQS